MPLLGAGGLAIANTLVWSLNPQVSTMFVPLAREGWLQKLVASPGHPFGQWRVLWAELLEDGKLSWFDSSRKRKSDFRSVSGRVADVGVGLESCWRSSIPAGTFMQVFRSGHGLTASCKAVTCRNRSCLAGTCQLLKFL